MLIEFNGYVFDSDDIYYVGEIYWDTNLTGFKVLVRGIKGEISLSWLDEDYKDKGSSVKYKYMQQVREKLLSLWKGDREVVKVY